MNVRTNTGSSNFGSSLEYWAKTGQAHRRFATRLAIFCIVTALCAALTSYAAAQDQVEDYYPVWAAHARYLQPLKVLDTDSALGRRNLHSKRITLKDMARMHGHLCDGLVTAWVELSAALRELFHEGVVDRTDVRVVSKNGPCWADAGAWITGARINQGTLMLDNSAGDGFIVQRISTGKRFRFHCGRGCIPRSLRRWSNPSAHAERAAR